MDVDIVIVNYNTSDLLRKALNSISMHVGSSLNQTTIVVDNASSDGSVDMVTNEFPHTQVLSLGDNLGFGTANNRGIRAGTTPFILFMNSDAELTSGALDYLVTYINDHPDCVITGPRLVYPDGSYQPSCRRFPTPLRNFWSVSGLEARHPRLFHHLQNWLSEDEHQQSHDVDMVSGACFLARRDYMESVGDFDENLFMYEEETDISIPAKVQGKSITYCPEAIVIHHGGASVESNKAGAFSTRHLFRSKYVCFRKHYGLMWAWITYTTDRILFGKSAVLNRIRGTKSDAAHNLKGCKRGWKESFISITELRRKPDFFQRIDS